MKSNYKRLGDYIEPCDLLNDNEEITLLQGISNEKYFQACKSNTNDIDLSRYRICRKGWFAYNRATTRNGDRISIAYRDGEDCLVSPSYKCFRIIDENLLNPYYLLLWFKRPQFDRYARFRSHGSAHEYFEYEEMCEVELPIPSIEEQNRIVGIYETIENRISILRQINDNLEAQAISKFHLLFDIDNENFNGTFSDFGDIVGGATPSTECKENFCADGIVWLSPRDLTSTGKKFIRKGETDITPLGYRSCSTKMLPPNTVLFTSRAPIGTVAIAMNELCTNQGFKSIIPYKHIGSYYIYYYLVESKKRIESYGSGTTFMEISGNVMKNIPAHIPESEPLRQFEAFCSKIFVLQDANEQEIDALLKAKNLLVTKMSGN